MIILIIFSIIVLFICGSLKIINSNLQQQNQLLKDKINCLEKDVRDQANENIILKSLIKNKKHDLYSRD